MDCSVEKGATWVSVGGGGRSLRTRDGNVWDWMSKSKGVGGVSMCLEAARKLSRTSRRESSRARAVSARAAGEVLEVVCEVMGRSEA